MGKLSTKDIKHIAKLSNIMLTDRETKSFKRELSKVISYIQNLQKVNTKGIEPTSQTTGLKNVYREDKVEIEDILSTEGAISGTDEVYNSLFKIPLVLKEKDFKK